MILFQINGRTVGQTRSTSQRTIRRLMLKLAEQHPGQEVVAVYPA